MIRKLSRLFALAALMSAVFPALAQPMLAEPFKAGEHYFQLPEAVRPRNPAKIEVVEEFQYGCPHCYRFEPQLNAWRSKQPADVDVQQMPIVWNQLGELHARAFYTAQALGVLDKTHHAMFVAIHEKSNMLNTKDKVQQIFTDAGVKKETFDKAFDSFGVTNQIAQSKSRMLSYKLEGTPELVVAGKYRISGSAFRSPTEQEAFAKMLAAADYLIDKERKQIAAKAGK